MKSTPKVSIIVVTYNNEQWVDQCFTSVMEQDYPNFELILVDNGSQDRSVAVAEDPKFKSLKPQIVKLDRNLGFAIGNNEGLKVATGEYIFLLNSDARIEKSVISEAVNYLEAHPDVAVLQNKMLSMQDPTKLDGAGSLFTNTGFLRHLLLENEADVDGTYPVFSAKGASMFVTRILLNQTYLFSEHFHSYFEDTDLSWRSWLLGFQVRYLTTVTTHHFGGATGLLLTSGFTDFHSFKNRLFCHLSYLQLSTLLRVLPVHLAICGLVIFVYVIKFKFSKAWGVAKALLWNLINIKLIAQHRRKYQSLRKLSDKQILAIAGSDVSLRYAIGSLFGYIGR